MIADVFTTFLSTLINVAPIIAILVVFQVAVLRRPLPNPHRILIGLLYAIAGMTFFLIGLKYALFPIGRTMARQLITTADAFPLANLTLSHVWTYAFALAIGFAAALAEPALIAVALKAETISGGTIPSRSLRIVVAIGAGIGAMLGCLRIVTGIPLSWGILGAYALVIALTAIAPRTLVPLAYDTGGVTTSTVTVPVITALGLGLASAIPGRSPLIDGFGVIAFTCLFPIMSVLTYASLASWQARRRAQLREAMRE